MACFKCPIHRSNDHTLDFRGTLKSSCNVTDKTAPPPTSGVGSNGAPGRRGGTRDYDDQSRGRVRRG
jgi:hypothetical protein